MKKLVIKLKQHTPLIHFQHDQEGATLRASEVKPKLDRFLLTELGNGDYEKGCDIAKGVDWMVGKGDHPALDYKLKIEITESESLDIIDINERKEYDKRDSDKNRPYIQDGNKKYLARIRKSDNRKIYALKTYPLFFANLDTDYNDNNEHRRFSYSYEPLSLTFIITNEKKLKNQTLYDFISNPALLNDFFFKTNFGTRQTKGFGSFYIDRSDSLFREESSSYRFNIIPNEDYIEEEFYNIFERIELFYKTLRSGINLKNRDKTLFYFKSLSYMYAENILNAKWDKRKIKEEFYGIPILSKPNTFDIRDMLGFSTNEQWLSYDNDSIEKSANNNSIERMPSPILFKPIYNENQDYYTIHIILQDKIVDVNGFKKAKSIELSSKKKHKRFSIDLPQNFSSASFFNYIFDPNHGIDISSHVDDIYQKHRYFRILEDIYSQIQSNL